SNVYLMLFGANGQTDWIFLPPEDIFAFEEGALDKFVIDVPDLGRLSRCCLGHDSSADPGWLVESVRVQHADSGQTWDFAFGQWLDEQVSGRTAICVSL
ncbi:MAG: hypothetical protein HC828_14420, partial [Blastochloris sp.]|nr:hypothetical protein [Blastochloris sp.]